jgi:hypothetical protein
MKLSQMQDIGRCRAIMGSVSQVRSLSQRVKKAEPNRLSTMKMIIF